MANRHRERQTKLPEKERGGSGMMHGVSWDVLSTLLKLIIEVVRLILEEL